MTLESAPRQHIDRLLAMLNEAGAAAPRLIADAQRLWTRTQRLLAMNLISPEADRQAMELACHAIQLPLRQAPRVPARRSIAMSLRERADQAAELILAAWPESSDAALLDRVARLLRDLPQREPALDEARLLADAINLEDFGATGLVLYSMHLARNAGGLEAVIDGLQKRQQYGYWEARLKDSFHFEPVRQIARQRLLHATQVTDLLLAELREDQSP